MRRIILVINNVRSANNVGAILRSADAFGIEKTYICGYSPYPAAAGDNRLPHISRKVNRAIHKTALGAEESSAWEYIEDINECLERLSGQGYLIAALEQTKDAVNLANFSPPEKIALVVGNELAGVEPLVLANSDRQLHIPMHGQKESLNVASATAIALYHLRNA